MPAVTSVKDMIRKPLLGLPLGVWETLVPRSEIAVCYHMVADQHMPHVRRLFPYKDSEQFAADIAYLKSKYRLIEEPDLASRILAGNGSKERVSSITFDDGFAQCYTVARMILNGAGVKGTFFIITECLDNKTLMYRNKVSLCTDRFLQMDTEERASVMDAFNQKTATSFSEAESFAKFILGIRVDRAPLLDDICDLVGLDPQRFLEEQKPYMSLEQVKQLAKEGHTIGAHGSNHHEFQALEPEEVERQIVQSCEIIHGITGRSPVPFAAPFTLEGLDRDLLARIARKNPMVGVIYGTSGVKREPRGFLNRVVADNPAGPLHGATNLPHLLRRAYLAGLSDSLTTRKR